MPVRSPSPYSHVSLIVIYPLQFLFPHSLIAYVQLPIPLSYPSLPYLWCYSSPGEHFPVIRK